MHLYAVHMVGPAGIQRTVSRIQLYRGGGTPADRVLSRAGSSRVELQAANTVPSWLLRKTLEAGSVSVPKQHNRMFRYIGCSQG